MLQCVRTSTAWDRVVVIVIADTLIQKQTDSVS